MSEQRRLAIHAGENEQPPAEQDEFEPAMARRERT